MSTSTKVAIILVEAAYVIGVAILTAYHFGVIRGERKNKKKEN